MLPFSDSQHQNDAIKNHMCSVTRSMCLIFVERVKPKTRWNCRNWNEHVCKLIKNTSHRTTPAKRMKIETKMSTVKGSPASSTQSVSFFISRLLINKRMPTGSMRRGASNHVYMVKSICHVYLNRRTSSIIYYTNSHSTYCTLNFGINSIPQQYRLMYEWTLSADKTMRT